MPADPAFADVDQDRLVAWMDEQGLESGSLRGAQRLTGGSQNVLIRFERGDRAFVLRMPPRGLWSERSETMRREARILSALGGTPVPHPALIAACADDDVLGSAFYLMEPVDGFNPAAGMPDAHRADPSVRHAMGLSMVDSLGALSTIDYRASGLEDFGRPQGYLKRQLERMEARFRSYAEAPDWPGPAALGPVERVAEWLADHRPQRDEPGLMHGDFHLANVMFRNDRPEVAAIIDWELATLGDPLVDLGWMLATWPQAGEVPIVGLDPADGFPSLAELVERYRERGGRPTDHIQWYAIFACYKLAVLLEGSFVRACAGKMDRAVGEKLHRRACALIDKADRWIAGGVFEGASAVRENAR